MFGHTHKRIHHTHNIGVTSCSKCNEIGGSANGHYNKLPGQASCLQCPDLMTATSTGTSCRCAKGAFSYLPAEELTDCHACPEGSICDEVGLLVEEMAAQSGWWRPNITSTDYYSCLVPSHCLGGSTSSCASYRSGPICATCISGAIPTSGNRTHYILIISFRHQHYLNILTYVYVCVLSING
jgi:hypothetical protein